jgi:hypothetical protein
MNTSLFKLCLFLCGLGVITAPAAPAAGKPDEPITIKLQVNMPQTWNLAPGEPLPDFIAGSISEALRRAGFTLPVEALRSAEDATKVPYLLKVEVTEWGRTIDGDFNCTFAATLRTPAGERRIGVYSNTTWAPGVIYAHSKSAYFPTRTEPIRALARDLESSELLSGSAA